MGETVATRVVVTAAEAKLLTRGRNRVERERDAAQFLAARLPRGWLFDFATSGNRSWTLRVTDLIGDLRWQEHGTNLARLAVDAAAEVGRGHWSSPQPRRQRRRPPWSFPVDADVFVEFASPMALSDEQRRRDIARLLARHPHSADAAPADLVAELTRRRLWPGTSAPTSNAELRDVQRIRHPRNGEARSG